MQYLSPETCQSHASVWQPRVDSQGSAYWYNVVDGSTSSGDTTAQQLSHSGGFPQQPGQNYGPPTLSITGPYLDRFNTVMEQIPTVSQPLPASIQYPIAQDEWVQEIGNDGNPIYLNKLTGERHWAKESDWLLKDFSQGYELYVNNYTKDYYWKPTEVPSPKKNTGRREHIPYEFRIERRKRKKKRYGEGTTARAPRYPSTANGRKSTQHSPHILSSGEEADDEQGILGMSLEGSDDIGSWLSGKGATFLKAFILSEPEGVQVPDEESGTEVCTSETEYDEEYFTGLPFKERMKWLGSHIVALSSGAKHKARHLAAQFFKTVSETSGCSSRRPRRARSNSAPESPSDNNFGVPLLRRARSINYVEDNEQRSIPRLSALSFSQGSHHRSESDPGSASCNSQSSFVVPPSPALEKYYPVRSPSGTFLGETKGISPTPREGVQRSLDSDFAAV